MARSAEKAATELSRWYQYKLEKEGKTLLTDETRPYLATECHDQKEAIRWRRDIIQEISTHVTSIQNAQLGEFRLRDLNDHINKLLREKGHWEERIKELGGPDYKKSAPKMLTKEGKEVPGNRGYRYSGFVKELENERKNTFFSFFFHFLSFLVIFGHFWSFFLHFFHFSNPFSLFRSCARSPRRPWTVRK